MAKAVGLDIGSRACKVAVLSGAGKGAKLLRYVEKEYDLGTAGAVTPEAVVAAMKAALSEARAPRNAVCGVVPAEQLVLREIAVPFTEDDQIQKVVKFEFEPHLHSASIDDVVIDYVKTGATKGGTRLLVFCAAKDLLRSRLAQLKEAGVDPLHLDVDVAALFNTAVQAGVFGKHANCLIIDIGARTTKTLLVQDGKLKVARSIRLGAHTPVRQLTDDFEGDAGAASRAMADAGTAEALAMPPERASTMEIVASVRAIEAAAAGGHESEFVARVLRETQRTLPTMAQDKPLTGVYLTGLGSARPHVRQRIGEHYSVEVEDLPTLDAITHSMPASEADKVARSGAVAIGAALKALGADAGEIDLRREEFRFARTFDAIKVALATAVTLVFFGLFLVVFTKSREVSLLRKQRDDLQKLMEKELRVDVLEDYEKTVKDARRETESERAKARDPDLYFQRMKSRLTAINGHLENELGLASDLPPIRSCLETWSVVMKCAKEVRGKIVYFVISEEKYTQEKADLKVVVGDFPDINVFTAELRKHTEIFESVDTGPSRQIKDKGIEIPVKIVLKPKEIAEPSKDAAGEPFEEDDR